MLMRVVYAVVVGVVVAIVCALLGALLNAVGLENVGAFLKDHSGLIGVLAAVVYFFFGDNTERR